VSKGKGLYESSCAACHGIDLRGGQQGGPNLLRSQTLSRLHEAVQGGKLADDVL